ncbi:ROK family transcriptional regulator [Microbacterium lushaniae]|uniref:ROK family transcriptional regulator n=1 Tax=Microbacterium lushaniae TaxID=2614639 RepID=A0A5J6L7C1_9MICO|nr:ROK family transcriptional regulator [Microbacterium lushaniae]QEW04317.1 ROK family transcriptional regulator [Microbacterium lushaniae]
MTSATDLPGRVVSLGPRTRSGLLSTTDVAGANQAVVLQSLADHGPLSRAELARLSGVTRASIGGVVAGLLEQGRLEELPVKSTPGRAGKPSRPLWFRAVGHFGAVVIQPGGIDVAVIDMQGNIITHECSPLPTQSDGFDDAALEVISATLSTAEAGLAAIGLTIPAFFNPDGDIVASTTLPPLVGSQLPTQLADAFNTTVVLEDDARALALGQRWFGQARGEREFTALQIGEGIGAGIMLDGRLHRGPLIGSEIGHTVVDLNGERCHCGLIGCWETIASLRWLRGRSAFAELSVGHEMTPRLLAELDRSGDEVARQIIDEYADHVAVGVVNLFHTLSVPLFILHGDVVGAGDRFLAQLRARVAIRAMPALKSAPEIRFDENGAQSAVLGAAAAATTFSLGVTL